MRKFFTWLLRAIGLMRHPKPQPAPPKPAPEPIPSPDTLPAPVFHGFWMRYGKFAHEREMTLLQLAPSVHGCPPNEIRFGYEDNGSGPYQWKMTATELESGQQDALYSRRANRIDDQWSNDRYAVWFPLWREDKPPWPFASPDQPKHCPRPPDPKPQPRPQNTTVVKINIWIKNAHGNVSHWAQSFEVVKHHCS